MIEFIEAKIIEMQNLLRSSYHPPSKSKEEYIKGALAAFEEVRLFLNSRHTKNL